MRYVGSFKRQFKEQETRSLRDRTRVRPGATLPDCVCLVCLLPSASNSRTSSSSSDSSDGIVVGTLDAEPPGTRQRSEVPQVVPLNAYISHCPVACQRQTNGTELLPS